MIQKYYKSLSLRYFVFFSLCFICLSCSSVQIPCLETLKQDCSDTDKNKTEVVIIGTIHKGHNSNNSYSPETLKDLIIALEPKVILNELPKCYVWPNGSPMFPYKSLSPESWASNRAAKQLKAKQLPFDRADREAYWRKTRYWDRFQENSQYYSEFNDKYEEFRTHSKNLNQLIKQQRDITRESGPRSINSQSFDTIVKKRYEIQHNILPEIVQKHGESIFSDNLLFHATEWQERNTIMAGNILKIALNPSYKGNRIIVLTGAEHRYILRDMLLYTDCIELKEYWEVLESE